LNQPKRYTVTSALPYANGPLHIGHIAGAYLPADIYVRFLKMKGEDVVFICGSDEHGAAITLRAKKEGITPKDIIDKYHELNKASFEKFGIDFSIYHRTSEPLHHQTASDYFTKLIEKGALTVEESEQYYDEEHQQFLADRYIMGECPKCGHQDAYGDQCEKCGASLTPTELIKPRSILSGKAPVLKSTKHWYLPMGDHESWLRAWFEQGEPASWKSHVVGQCKSWLDGGLGSRAMTRDLDWGVKVPLKDAEGKVLYVWLDAPIGYISATKQWAADNGKNWEDYWKKDSGTKLIHFIGKDNIVFHCLIFPILLNVHGDYVLPSQVPANGFLNLEGDKLSTSRNWAVWLHEYLEDFPDKKDELRYVLTSIMPENRDSEFTWKDYQARVNNELVAILGNFVNRVMVLSHNYFGGKFDIQLDMPFYPELEDSTDVDAYTRSLDNFQFREALAALMRLARTGNNFLQTHEPWKKFDKNNPDSEQNKEVQIVLYRLLEHIAKIAVLAQPFLPDTAEKIKRMLNIGELSYEFLTQTTIQPDEDYKIEMVKFEQLQLNRLLPLQLEMGQPQLLFKKIEDKEIEEQIAKLEKNKMERAKEQEVKQENSVKEAVTFDDFIKLEIRTGEIVSAEKVKGADKLLKLAVDLGFEQRTIVSGIAEHYQPENVVGQKVSVLLNLQPRKIRGVESQGMILMGEDSKGRLVFISPATDLANGSVIR
jgi:methionyl-tRNA synthetase